MKELEEFIKLLSGSFDNKEQFERMQKKGDNKFPFAEHINTVCNDRIRNLPEDFEGKFLIEESYYTVDGNTHGSPHLFLFTQEEEGIRLTSYEIPEGYDKTSFNHSDFQGADYAQLKASEKFTPAVYMLNEGVWEGGSVSMFSPVLKFTLFERFSRDYLEVSETMEVNGRRTFGYDEPVIYKRNSPGFCFA